ncbi:hypothetical protein FPV67DRAFT_1662548 [Lyophyllum atratum]|nr:hypothetical protein FPV67DRAFT_1662548 [Lyophyllum atratum]
MSAHLKEEDEESGSEYEEPYAQQNYPRAARNVFEDEDGDPICFFIHKSIKSRFAIDNLTRDIEMYGGVVRPDDQHVDTVLVDERYVNKDDLQITYDADFDASRRATWVEPMSFVRHCIEVGSVRHRPRPRKGMGGLPREAHRVPYTPKDDQNLARYLAIRIPDTAAGGRRGNGVFKELERAAELNPQRFAWAKRHTWQSWRNRYNKNVDRFNRMIDHYAKKENPTQKQLYALDRRLVHNQLFNIDQDHSSGEDEEDDRHPSPPPAKRRHVDEPPAAVVESVEVDFRRSTNRKGKERASDDVYESDNEIKDYESLFGSSEPDEPRPSARQRMQPIINRERQQHRPSPVLFPTEPQTSQATLVASSFHQSRAPTRMSRKRPPNSSPPPQIEDQIPGPLRETVQVVENVTGDNVAPSPPTYNVNLSDASHHQSLPAAAEGTIAHARAALATSSQRPHPVAIKRAQRPRPEPPVLSAPIPPTAEAPYRNTRSRSRSVEPSVLPSRPRPRKKKAAEVVEEATVMASLEEVSDEDDVPTLESQEMGSTSTPVRETVEDEMSVEEFLVNDISGRSNDIERSVQDTDEADPEAASPPAEAVDASMDSDDAQTDQLLHQPPEERTSQRPNAIFIIDPDEAIRQFNAGKPVSSTARSSRLSSVRPVAFPRLQSNAPTRSRHRASRSSRDPFEAAHAVTPQPRTPANHRSRSASSVESFPMPGTKASTAKRRIEEEEKHTPYTPPRGTRAALFRR